MKKGRIFLISALPLLLLGGVANGASGPDELWEISTKMEMAGMPFALPPQTSQNCIPKGQAANPEKAVPQDKEQQCTMSDVKVSGNKSSWSMKCEGKNPMSGTGEFTSGEGTYSGSMKMKGQQEGRPVDMNMSYSGKRIGACTYENPVAKIAKANDASFEQLCQDALAHKRYENFLKPDCRAYKEPGAKEVCEKRGCGKLQPQICEKLSAELNTPEGFKSIAKNKAAQTLAGECNLPYAQAAAVFCRKQIESKDYTTLVEYCEKEARGLYDQHCAGRDYTSAMDSGYGPVCSHFNRQGGGEGEEEAPEMGAGSRGGGTPGLGRTGRPGGGTRPGSGYPAPGAGMNAEQALQAQQAMEQMQMQQEQSPPQGPELNPAEAVLQNAKKLKGMFGF